MNMTLPRLTGALLAAALLAGCGEMKLKVWPFDDGPTIRSRTPANATEYQCDGNTRFYVRTLDGGAAVWLILREREVRLDRIGAEGASRYSNGIAVLEISGDSATLSDGVAAAYSGCKRAAGGA